MSDTRTPVVVVVLALGVVVAMLLLSAITRPGEQFASFDPAGQRVTVHDLFPDEWTVCFDDAGTLCTEAGEIRSRLRFHLPETD